MPLGWWFIAGVGSALLALSFAGLWFDYARVLTNAHLDPTYSLLNAPLFAMPLAAWLGRSPHISETRTPLFLPASRCLNGQDETPHPVGTRGVE